MKKCLIIILLFVFWNTKGQTNASFVFYDACKQEVVKLPYRLWDSQTNSTILIEAGQSVDLNPGYYQVRIDLTMDNKLSTLYFNIYTRDEPIRTDTLFLESARFLLPERLHPPPEQLIHYCCDKPCDGYIEEVDLNGVIRFKGNFRNGKPTSNLKFYDASGKRTKTNVYRNGKFVRAK